MKDYAKLVMVSAALFLMFACGPGGPANKPINNSAQKNAAAPEDSFAIGRTLYNQNCAACHRVNGKGGVMEFDGKKIDPDDLTGEKIKKTADEKIYTDILEGFPEDGMPGFKGRLNEPQIKEIVRYIRGEFQK